MYLGGGFLEGAYDFTKPQALVTLRAGKTVLRNNSQVPVTQTLEYPAITKHKMGVSGISVLLM